MENQKISKHHVVDEDIEALKDAIKALNKSTSWRMLRANFAYLKDYFLDHPNQVTIARFSSKYDKVEK